MSLTILLHAATRLLPPPSPPWPTARPVLARAARCRPWTPPPSPRARPASRPWRTRVWTATTFSPRPMQWVAVEIFWGSSYRLIFLKKLFRYSLLFSGRISSLHLLCCCSHPGRGDKVAEVQRQGILQHCQGLKEQLPWKVFGGFINKNWIHFDISFFYFAWWRLFRFGLACESFI